MNIARIRLVAMLLPIFIDCIGNMVVGSHSFGRTLSSTAWKVREHKFWGWTHALIDAIFGKGHCMTQALIEDKYGSVWAAWRSSFERA